MKTMKRIASLLLAMVMVFGMTTAAFADDTYSITIKNVKVDHTYEVYQIFTGDLSYNDSSAAVLSNIVWGDGVTADGQTALGAADKKAETLKTEADAEAFAKALVENEYLTNARMVTVTKSESTTIEGLKPGYYLIKDQDTTQDGENGAYTSYMLKVVESITVDPKVDSPELKKKIVEDGVEVDANNGSIGDVVKYKLTSTVPAMDGYDKYYFIVHDTLTKGLTFNNDIEIVVGAKTLTADTDYTVTTGTDEDGGTTIKIVFKDFIQYKEIADADIVISYTATINKNAVIGNLGNPNTAYLEYSNNPNKDQKGENEPEPDDVTGKTPEDTTITYVTGIELIKVDEDGNRLTGAQFTLTGTKLNKVKVITETFTEDAAGTYYKLTDGSYTETEPNDQTVGKYDSTTTKYTLTEAVTWIETTEEVSATGTVGDDGVLIFDGLAEGTYEIEEIIAPTGYNLLKDKITVVITCTEPTEVDAKDNTATWAYTITGAVTQDETTSEDGRVHITVENKAGATLPETGGTGTTMFYIIGGVLVLAAVVLLVTKRRMGTEK